IWQINNNFPTFEYHLVSRSMPYTILHTLNYIGSQYLLAGPLIAVILFYHAIKRKAADKFELVLKYNFIGFFVFFLLATFKGRVEAHWPTIGFIPLLILSFSGILKSPKAVKWIRACFIPGFLASLFFRLAVITPIFPAESGIFREFHNWDVWAKEIKELADDRTVVFANTFQRPAKYSFYNNGEFAHSVNNVYYRKNQYDVWPFEDSVRGKKVIYLADMVGLKEHCSVVGECYRYDFFDDFISYNKLSTQTDISEITANAGDSVDIQIELTNNSNKDFSFITTDGIQSNLVAVFVKPHYYKKPQILHSIDYEILKVGDIKEYSAKLKLPTQAGKYYCYVGVTHKQMSPPFNGRPIVVTVE
ncbi:MAG: hypothetical protein MI922_09340, partial [Bacteroidales bacterium]|nr:hypothetical protein [Bacteroidales bacterium]